MFESEPADEGRQRRVVVRALVVLGVCGLLGYEGASAVPRLLGYGGFRPNVVVRRQTAGLGVPGVPARFGQGFPGGPFGFGQQGDLELLKQFDADRDGHLNLAERKAAREYLNSSGRVAPGRRGFGGGGRRVAAEPGPHLTPADVRSYPASTPLYDADTLRTIFIQFEESDWEDALTDFYHTDVDIPTTVIVDGKTYRDVGVRFRGNSSFRMVPAGRKHSFAVSFDLVHDDQQLLGYRTLHLLNANQDPTFLKAVLYAEIARDYIPAPKGNFMRVVVNGESWGVYPNVQAYNKDFLRDNFGTTKGARWTAPGSPRGRAGLEYLGDSPAQYKRLFEIKTKDDPKAWADLVNLCKVLNQTPPAQLEAALAPILDVDETLRFLALDNALINNDGYWTRASDYSLYEDTSGKFHIIPHDFNETVNETEGRGFGGGVRPFSTELDPLIGLDDETKPLRSQLLAVPALRAKYLGYVRDIAQKWLDWKKLGPIALKYQALIADDVKKDTHKLYGFDDFDANGLGSESTRNFAVGRRAYLLSYSPGN